MINIEQLSVFTINPYKNFLYESTFRLLASLDTDYIPLGASIGGVPAGAIAGWLDQKTKIALVVSIYVSKKFRRRGVGTALLTAMTDIYKKTAADEIKMTFVSPEIPGDLQAILKKLGWSEPAPFIHTFKMDKKIMESPLMKYRKLGPEYNYVIWKNFGADEREALKNQKWYPDNLSPFRLEENEIAADYSLILKYKSEVAGWLIVTHEDEETLFYHLAYVREDLQRLGRLMSLFLEAGSIQIAQNKYAYAAGRVNAKNTRMVTFTDKHLRPYTHKFETSYESRKQL
jgi:GNAT superfamily N-acetyltransferase